MAIQEDLIRIIQSRPCLDAIVNGEDDMLNLETSAVIDVKHPLNAYFVLKQAFVVSERVIKMADNGFDCPWRFHVHKRDLQSVMSGLLNIQIYSGNSAEQVSKGQLSFKGISYFGHPLDANDIEAITSIAQARMRLNSVVQWLEAALNIAKENEKDAEMASMEKRLEKAKKLHDEFIVNHGFLHVDHSKNQSRIVYTNHGLYYPNVLSKAKLLQVQRHVNALKVFEKLVETFKNLSPLAIDPDPKLFQSGIDDDTLPFFLAYFLERNIIELCQGKKDHQTKNERCFLSHFGNPGSYLSPFKYEQLQSSPLVGMFHDFASEFQTSALKEASKVRLKTTPLNVQNEIRDFTDLRSSKVAYFHDQDHPTAQKMSQKIEKALNFHLSTEFYASENYQIMNYGVGGNIVGHLDSVGTLDPIAYQRNLKHGGERFSTFMVYLSTSQAGGRTVFPQLDLSIQPVQGSALFWFNLDSSDVYDTRSFHMGCPVLYGNKWIANKWTKTLAQWRQYPCRPNRTSYSLL
ncbi:prolyl 4-hydroxylase subunit alpha-1-like [Tigriopus californicus]|nr:prolyl 4-hydroxylase subunit alpha-1-like [Tigriopus californicus]